MLRKFLKCDICGSTWDITDTDLYDKVVPGMCYIHKKVSDGVRRFNLQTMEAPEDGRLIRDDLDLCDKCYNKLDRFIFELANGKEK